MGRTGGAQWRWLQGDLAAVDRLVTPWLLVVGHRPMYIDRFAAARCLNCALCHCLLKHMEHHCG